MRPLKGTGLLWLAVVLALLIAVLGVLQWRWVREASEAERVRMQSLVDARVAQFAQEFDRRITNIYAQFVSLPGEDQGPTLAARAAELLAEENDPPVVREIYVVIGRPGAPLRLERFDAASGRFSALAWPDELKELHERLVRGQPPPGTRPAVWRVGPRVDLAIPALIVPRPILRLRGPRTASPPAGDGEVLAVVATLDERVLVERVLPGLVARHFPEEPGFSYRVLVREERSGRALFVSPAQADPAGFAQPDASAHILRIRNEFFDRMQTERARAAGGPALHGGPATTFGSPPGPPPGELSPDGPLRGRGRMQVFLSPEFASGEAIIVVPEIGAPGARWELAAVHSEGSLARAVARSRRWNLGLSLGVLALLGASVALALVASQRAQRLARDRVEFVAGVSHELKTPLAVIRSAAENLADGVVETPAQVTQYGALIADEGRKLSEMIDQVLRFAGLEAGQALRLAPTDPSLVVDDALESLSPMIAGAGVLVERLEDRDLPRVAADREALARAVANLVSNAVKHAGEAAWIGVRVSADRARGVVRIAVSDRGAGIPPHEQTRVFEPFFRGARALGAQVHGSGLGLSLVKRIAEQHRGRVELDSRPGAGSTFTLIVPAAETAGSLQGVGATAPASSAGDANPQWPAVSSSGKAR